MTNERIKTIIFQKIKSDPILGAFPEIEKDEHAPVDSSKDRIVITIPGGIEVGKIGKSYVVVAVYVPDKKRTYKGKSYLASDSERIEKLERICNEMFSSLTYGEYEEERYWYGLDKLIIEKDEATNSHFLNVRLLFEIANFKL